MRHLFPGALLASTLLIGGCGSATPPTAPDAMPVDPGAPPPTGAGSFGTFAGVGHRASGTVRFSAEGGVGRLEFSSDFTVEAVPGPFVYLNTSDNANTGQPLRVAALRNNQGSQSYSFQLPAGVSYTWVLIWCDPFNVPVAEAPITGSPPSSLLREDPQDGI